MARMGFVMGRPLRSILWRDTDQHLLSKNERGQLTKCVTDVLDKATLYVRQMERLKQSLSSAPEPVQRRLRTNRASAGDVKGLLQRPYSVKGQWARVKVWKASIAGFYTQARSNPLGAGPSVDIGSTRSNTNAGEETPPTIECCEQGSTEKVWQPEWLSWKPSKKKSQRSKGTRAQKRLAYPVTTNTLIGSPSVVLEAKLTKADGAPDLGPPASGMVPLFTGECPNIPQWALPFPAVVRSETGMADAVDLND